jgi:hypothetical protein
LKLRAQTQRHDDEEADHHHHDGEDECRGAREQTTARPCRVVGTRSTEYHRRRGRLGVANFGLWRRHDVVRLSIRPGGCHWFGQPGGVAVILSRGDHA